MASGVVTAVVPSLGTGLSAAEESRNTSSTAETTIAERAAPLAIIRVRAWGDRYHDVVETVVKS